MLICRSHPEAEAAADRAAFVGHRPSGSSGPDGSVRRTVHPPGCGRMEAGVPTNTMTSPPRRTRLQIDARARPFVGWLVGAAAFTLVSFAFSGLFDGWTLGTLLRSAIIGFVFWAPLMVLWARRRAASSTPGDAPPDAETAS